MKDRKVKVLMLVPPLVEIAYKSEEYSHLFKIEKNYFIPKNSYQIGCEGAYFDYILTSFDCDLEEAIERWGIDLILFLTPTEQMRADEVPFPKNIDAYSEIPRIGIFHNDKYSPCKYGCYQFLRKLKAEACFCSLSVPNELSYETHDLPVFHQSNALTLRPVLKDYGLPKDIAIGAFGRGFISYKDSKHYPWRRGVMNKLQNRINIFHAAPITSGAINGAPTLTGEEYSKMINRCHACITCGTEQSNFLAKHFEIPASKSCLITEESAILKEYGFKDMVNCVFATPENIDAKLEQLFNEEGLLERITTAGYDLAHSWVDENNLLIPMVEWYKLRSQLGHNEKIVQESIFRLKIVSKSRNDIRRILNGPDLLIDGCNAGFNHLMNNQLPEARNKFQHVMEYIEYHPVARIGMGIVSLFSKDIRKALAYFSLNGHHIMNQCGLDKYNDPLECAYLAIIYSIGGGAAEVQEIFQQTQNFKHPALSAANALLHGDDTLLSEEKNILSQAPVERFTSKDWYIHFKTIINQYK